MLTRITNHLAYYGKAAAHTFWQAAVASIVGANLGSVLGANHLPQVGELQKIALAAAVAGGAAVLSYVKQLLVLVPPASVPAIEDEPAV